MIAVTMPCFGTTDRTRDNAVELAGRIISQVYRETGGFDVSVFLEKQNR